MKNLGFYTLLLSLSLFANSCSQEEAQPVVVTSAAEQLSEQERLDNSLVDAIQNVDGMSLDRRYAEIKDILKKGANIKTKNVFGESLLADAVHFGDGKSDDIRVVQLLINAGADVNEVAPNGRSPLTKAAESNNKDVVQLFLQYGLKLDTENGTRALVKAAFYGHKEMVKLLVKSGVKPNDIYGQALFTGNSDETYATAAVFGSFADIALEEIRPLVRMNTPEMHQSFIAAHLEKIHGVCIQLNAYQFDTMYRTEVVREPTECGSMGRLGSLTYMHCYGLMASNSAALAKLQKVVDLAATQARSALKVPVPLENVTDPAELRAYNKSVRMSKNLYLEFVFPLVKQTQSIMGHHKHRNAQMEQAATACKKKDFVQGSKDMAVAIYSISKNLKEQEAGYRKEAKLLGTVEGHMEYQMPALNAATELRAHEEELERERLARERQNSEAAEGTPAVVPAN